MSSSSSTAAQVGFTAPPSLTFQPNRPLGINTIAKAFVTIATFLGKENPEEYTFHTGRCTGATLFVAGGGSKEHLKIAGGWRSNTAPERYVDQSDLTRYNVAGTFAIPGSIRESGDNRMLRTTATEPANTTTRFR